MASYALLQRMGVMCHNLSLSFSGSTLTPPIGNTSTLLHHPFGEGVNPVMVHLFEQVRENWGGLEFDVKVCRKKKKKQTSVESVVGGISGEPGQPGPCSCSSPARGTLEGHLCAFGAEGRPAVRCWLFPRGQRGTFQTKR